MGSMPEKWKTRLVQSQCSDNKTKKSHMGKHRRSFVLSSLTHPSCMTLINLPPPPLVLLGVAKTVDLK